MQHLKNFGFGRKEMECYIEEESKELVNILRKKCHKAIYMHDVFDVGVLNVLWAMMAGQRFNHNDYRLKKLLKIIHDSFRLLDISGGMLNQLPFLRYIAPSVCGYNDISDTLKRMYEFLEVSN